MCMYVCFTQGGRSLLGLSEAGGAERKGPCKPSEIKSLRCNQYIAQHGDPGLG